MPVIRDQPAPASHLPKHLKLLEAEAIGIMRDVVAEFRNPVMLYSIGKDSSVMLHLARKAFFPARLPFPLLHIDTGWKFREMIAFRDATARHLEFNLIVHVNEEGRARGINPITSGSVLHTAVMKTEALKQALDRYRFDAAFGGARRDEEKSRAKERVFSVRSLHHGWDPKTSGPSFGASTTRACARASRCGSSRSPIGPSLMSGNTSRPKRSQSSRSISLSPARW